MRSLNIHGVPHGPERGTTFCQLHMRAVGDGDDITIEPWRVRPLPVMRDLDVDRSAFDRIIQAGGFVSVNTGAAPDANALPTAKEDADITIDILSYFLRCSSNLKTARRLSCRRELLEPSGKPRLETRL